MNEDQAESPKVIVAQMLKLVTDLLRACDIYPIESYGWLNAADVDPELVGHAMWQTDSLTFRLLDARAAARESHNVPFPELASWQRFLISTGGDFEGLMDTARLSIGLALFQREAGDVMRFGGDSLFQLHLIAALVALGAASDRLRDVFIAAIFRTETKTYERKSWKAKGDRRLYETPFAEALDQVTSPHESATKLPALAAEIHAYRQKRNAVVHELATESGRIASEVANLPRPQTHDQAIDLAYTKQQYSDFMKHAAEVERAHLTRIEAELSHPIQWYKLLIQASHHVFVVENTIRRERTA